MGRAVVVKEEEAGLNLRLAKTAGSQEVICLKKVRNIPGPK